ncbi:MAG: molybdopterin-guanine dinucleotide biosynthesis protein B [Burkholderiales bacterium]
MKVFGFAGFSGSGKTTLIEQLIPRFVMEGIKVSLIKHAHDDFDIDQKGKDSYRHREAGASEVMVTGGRRWVLMHELRGEREPELSEQLKRLEPCDLVLIEGFKAYPIPKLEIHRKGNEKPLLFPEDQNIVAVATDTKLDTNLPQLDLNDPDAISYFILRYLEIRQ